MGWTRQKNLCPPWAFHSPLRATGSSWRAIYPTLCLTSLSEAIYTLANVAYLNIIGPYCTVELAILPILRQITWEFFLAWQRLFEYIADMACEKKRSMRVFDRRCAGSVRRNRSGILVPGVGDDEVK